MVKRYVGRMVVPILVCHPVIGLRRDVQTIHTKVVDVPTSAYSSSAWPAEYTADERGLSDMIPIKPILKAPSDAQGVFVEVLRMDGPTTGNAVTQDGTENLGEWTHVGVGTDAGGAKSALNTAVVEASAKMMARVPKTFTEADMGGYGPITRSVPQALVDLHGPFQSPEVGVFNPDTKLGLLSAVDAALKLMGDLEYEGPEGEPTFDTDPSAYWWRAVWKSKLTFKGGPQRVMTHLSLFLFMDTDTRALTATAHLREGMDSGLDEALASQKSYNAALAEAIATKADGGVPAWPSPSRPAATTKPALHEELVAPFDAWWENVSNVRSKAMSSVGPTAESAFANYRAGGGAGSFEDWTASRADRVAAATAGASEGTDWWSSLGTALGWVGDKATDALKWAGNGTVDLLKSWGPMGTVGAYAGVKAVNTVSSGDTNKLLLYGAVTIGIFALLK